MRIFENSFQRNNWRGNVNDLTENKYVFGKTIIVFFFDTNSQLSKAHCFRYPVSKEMYRQIVGIPMGTNCAALVVDLVALF